MKSENIVSVVLDFLNQMEIYKVLTGLEAGIYNIIRNDLITVFADDNVDKLFEILTSFDDLYIDYLEKNSYFDKTLLITLRNKILAAYIEKIKNAPLEED